MDGRLDSIGPTGASKNRRILIIDDNEDIHNDFRRILCPKADTSDLDALEASLFGGVSPVTHHIDFELSSAYQGMEALTKVRRAIEDGAPYALAFVDMRMPPGWDGMETLSRIWQEDPALQAVICSAYSDCSWDDVATRFGQTDRLLILKKPFDAIEVRQISCALTEKWSQHREVSEAAHRMSLQYAVTRILVESRSLLEAGPRVLRMIGEAFGWSFGALWVVDEGSQTLEAACTWSAAAGEKARSLGAAAAGRARAHGEALFTAEEGEDGLLSMLHIPIRSGDATVGVLELCGAAPRAPDPALLDTMGELCAKLGYFIKDKLVEAALAKSEASHRGLLHALPDIILRVDKDGACRDYKASRDLAPHMQPSFSVNKHVGDGLPPPAAQQFMVHLEQALLRNATQVLEYEETLGGELRSFEIRIAGIDQAEAMVIVRDVTSPRRGRDV